MSDSFFALDAGSLLNATLTVAQNSMLLDRVPVDGNRNLDLTLAVPVTTTGATNTKFVGIWETYDSTTDKFLMRRTMAWHVAAPAAGNTSVMHDRVPHQGDYFSLRVQSTGANVVLGSIQLAHTEDDCILPATWMNNQTSGIPGVPFQEERSSLFQLVAEPVNAGATETWLVPPYHGPAYMSCITPAACVINLRSGLYSDAAAAFGYLAQFAPATGDTWRPLWLPPRIHQVELVNGGAGVLNFYVNITPAFALAH